MLTATAPYGVRRATTVTSGSVDMSVMFFDPAQQINLVRDGASLVPALKHSTGKTATNTATQDNAKGADKDEDATED